MLLKTVYNAYLFSLKKHRILSEKNAFLQKIMHKAILILF